MNPSTTALTLNMQLPNIATVSWAVQGDTLSREITATLVDGSTAWNPQSGYHGVVRAHKPDGTNCVYDVDEDGNPAVTWTGNVATVKIVQQALAVAGTVLMQLEFYDTNDARVTAFGWANNVQPSAVTDTEFLSSDYYNILSLQIAGVLGASSHPPYIDSVTKNWMVWDENSAAYVDSGYSSVGTVGPAPAVTSTAYQYANSNSGTTVPTSWSDTRPATSPGTWAWTKTTITFDNDSTTTLYTTAYQGNDGTGSPGTSTPLMDGVAAVGTANAYSREDHVHPSDTSRAAASDVATLTDSRLRGKQVAIYADSWAADYHGSFGADYISGFTGVTAHVAADPGGTLARIYTNAWDEFDADVYVISGGLNDLGANTTITSYISAITTWVTAIKTINADAEIYFVTPPMMRADTVHSKLYPLELYRIAIWRMAAIKNYNVINALKWVDITFESDKTHPIVADAPKIGKHVIAAISNYGDEETHIHDYCNINGLLVVNNSNQLEYFCDGGNLYLRAQYFDQPYTSGSQVTINLPAGTGADIKPFSYTVMAGDVNPVYVTHNNNADTINFYRAAATGIIGIYIHGALFPLTLAPTVFTT